MVELLAGVYAQRPQDEWMLREVREILLLQLQDAFTEQCRQTGKTAQSISGYRQGAGYSADNCTVTFTEIVDRDEAIEMLNLPIVYSYNISRTTQAIGAGEFVFSDAREGKSGRIVTLQYDTSSLSVIGIDRENVVPTMKLKQISLAVLSSEPDEKMNAAIKESGFAVKRINGSYAVYDPKAVNDALIGKLIAFF